MDWTNVSVAAITVVGTLGGGIVTQVFAIRSKRIDAQMQRVYRTEELRELGRKEATDEKRAIYAALNTAAHSLRAAARSYLDEKRDGRSPDLAGLQGAWDTLRESYSRAQMVLSDRAIDFASEANRCLGIGHRAVLEVDASDPAAVAAVDFYVNDTLGFAVRLLRSGIREDLGLESAADIDLNERLATLKQTRKEFDRRARTDTPQPDPHG
ncbi:hypothetical protein ACFWPK_11025 [Nocardia sp. NPDC058519]|uniref:hypothetical protein n=1 Tax=Nocardia sp. NPDC058519 TaxID=3346535 RepID=UPI003666DC3D